MKILLHQQRRKVFVRVVLVAMLLGACLAFVKTQKEMLIKRSVDFLEQVVGHQLGLEVEIAQVSGDLWGSVKLQGLSLKDPALSGPSQVVFFAESIQVQYRLLDFFSKKFTSKVDIHISHPVFRWTPRISLKRNRLPLLDWLKNLAMSQQGAWVLRVDKMQFVLGGDRIHLTDIDIEFTRNQFKVVLPVRHWQLGEMDVSTVLDLDGSFELGNALLEDRLSGKIRTTTSIINWKPMDRESGFDFVITRKGLKASSSDFLGGLRFEAEVDFENDFETEIRVEGTNYAMSALAPFWDERGSEKSPGHVDLTLNIQGDPLAPSVDFQSRLYNGQVGHRAYKMMDVNASGVYPTLRIYNSRILMHDGVSMRFADESIEVGELFLQETYQGLASRSLQETVVWGDWELSRGRDASERPEVLIERELSGNTRAYFRKFAYEDSIDPFDPKDTEVGLEYRIRAKDSLKIGVRDDEEFIGVERKMNF